ncbi:MULTISPECIES: A24 family peptidase [unclassified Polynucleobacter]|uniref:prepilin peptidase n=1 Tax=unclassified Polynucleobacter TaxID=2640945 RepID=UPI0008C8120B|nr:MULTISPECIES: A24 family peptidase [unclassified Polynucleobacter]OHC09139.1 MAG: peptidase A24 [Polynucleobacter sp. GWA2_45_21]HBK42917.1 prepilin peptidase [Polynucleobacter sp.]
MASIWIVKSLLVLALLYLAYIDWRTLRLPNAITFPLIFLGIAFNSIADLHLTTPSAALIGALLGYASLWILNTAYRLLKNRNGIGMGDAKLLAALGAWLGWGALPSILLIASVTGIVGGIIWLQLRGHQLQQAFPFGPFLVIAGIIELLWPQLIPTLILPKLI